MRKFLAILLIAMIACSTFEDDMNGIWDTVKEWYQKLKDMGVIDIIVNLLRTYGVPAAKKACCQYLPAACSVCELILNLI